MNPNQPNGPEHPTELISAYMDGVLDAEDRVRVSDHLRTCAGCRQLLADFRTLAAAALREEVPPVPGDLAARIGVRIDAAQVTRAPRRWRLFTGSPLPLATAAAAVVVFASLWIVLRGRVPEPRLEAPPPSAVEPAPVARDAQPAPVPAPPASTTPQHRRVREEIRMDAPPRKEKAIAEGKAAADAATESQDAETSRMLVTGPPAGALMGLAVGATDPGLVLVFPLPDARVSILPDSRIRLESGTYSCTLLAVEPAEVEALQELRASAARLDRRRPESAAASAGTSPSSEIVIPPPPGSDPASADLVAQMHRRVRTLVQERLLPRAEEQCGPAPAALRQIH